MDGVNTLTMGQGGTIRYNKEQILEQIRQIEQSIKIDKKNIIVKTFKIGQRLNWLEMIDSTKTSKQNLSLANYEYEYSRFLIKLYRLMRDFPKLQCSTLPVRWFKNNFSQLQKICDGNIEFWGPIPILEDSVTGIKL